MDILIRPNELAHQLQFALTGYLLATFIISPLLTLAMWRIAAGRRGVFLIVTLGLFLAFTLVFYGLLFLIEHAWGTLDVWGREVTTGLCLLTGLLIVLMLALPLRLALNETPSPLQQEYDALTEDQMSPFDRSRKARMARYRRK